MTAHLPLAFAQLGDEWQLVALTSLLPGVNHLVGPQGQWLGEYIPAIFRSYPFTLSRAGSKDSDGYLLCALAEGEHIVDAERGVPFFDESGQACEQTRRIGNFLVEIEASRLQTTRAVRALIEAKLLVAWNLQSEHNGEVRDVSGFFKIDEVGFSKITQETFLKLQNAGALPLAYAQIYAREQFGRLQQAIKKQEQLRENSLDNHA